jgi:ribosome-binding factor A
MSTTFRPERAGEAIRMAVARALATEIQDPRLRHVTITDVEMTHDLQFARIFYTVLGDEEARREAERGFESARSFLRGRIGDEVPLRTVPDIAFHYDKSTDNAMRIEEILSSLPELQKEEEEASD